MGFALRRSRAAIFADCGLGKTLIQLAWAQNVVNHTGGRVLILTPLALFTLDTGSWETRGAAAAAAEPAEKRAVTLAAPVRADRRPVDRAAAKDREVVSAEA